MNKPNTEKLKQILNFEKVSETYLRNKIVIISIFLSFIVIQSHAYNIIAFGIDENSTGTFERVSYIVHDYWWGVRPIVLINFFAISGFLFYRHFTPDMILSKYKSRAKSVLLPYIIWASFYYVIFDLLAKLPVIGKYINNTNGITLLGWFRSLVTDEYYTLWFLKVLIVYIALCPVFYFLLKDYKGLPTGLILIVVVLVVKYMGGLDFFRNLEGYLIGAWIGINHKDWVLYKSKALTWISIIYLIFELAVKSFYMNVFYEALLIPVIWFVADIAGTEKKLPEWMSYTFFIYVAHDIILETLKKICQILFGLSGLASLLEFIFLPFVALFLVVLVAIFLKKFCRPVWRILSGDR